MPGQLNQAELLKIFPVINRPSLLHGRKKKGRKVKSGLHGRGRISAEAKIDPFKHKYQARRQG